MTSVIGKVEQAAAKAIDKVNPAKPAEMPKGVKERLKRGEERMTQISARRKEAIEFANNNHYVTISEDRARLVFQSTATVTDGGDMPDHRVRRSHDMLGPVLKRKISTATQRAPGYEIIPATPDPQDYSASRVAENVADAGYDKWHIKKATKELIWNALVTEEGFIGARWNSNVGPFVDASVHPYADWVDPETGIAPFANQPDPDHPHYVGSGEIEIVVYGGLDVIWEPGVNFEDSRWIAIKQAKPRDVVEEEPGFITGDGGQLKADATTAYPMAPSEKRRKGTNLVMVTEYLERPSAKNVRGRRLLIANDRIIFPEEDYPLTDCHGNILDEPCLHRITYAINPSSDRDRGLVTSVIDTIRTYDMTANKIMEWIQVALAPQMTAPQGSVLTPLTDEPALLIETDPAVIAASGQKPEWRAVPQIPPELGAERERALTELSEITLDTQIPSNIEAAKSIQALYERDQLAWQDFIVDLADTHARLMRDCLTIVQQRYSEERLIQFRGAAGWENLPEDFRGADIRGQTDVRVQPGSLESHTRAAIEAKIAQINNMFPGYFPPPVIISAMNSATPERLIETFERDEARAYRVIGLIKSNQFFGVPPRPTVPGEEVPLLDPETEEPIIEIATGQMVMMDEVPGWMPRPFDNADLHKTIFESWMKTPDYEELEDVQKEAAMIYYQALLDLEARAAERRAQLQTQTAEEMGMENAAKRPGAKPLPNEPSPETIEANAMPSAVPAK